MAIQSLTIEQEAIKKLRLALIGLIVFQNECIESVTDEDDPDLINWIDRAKKRITEAEIALDETKDFPK